MGSGIFNVGVSGLNAAQLGIQTTSHNIANASTPGFTRQRIVQGTNTPLFTGAGFVGQGTNVETVQRVYSQYLTEQVLGSASTVSEMDSYLAQINQIDNLLADPDAGLSPAMAEFFKGVQELAANPASIPARQAVISSGQALTSRFQSLDTRIQEIRDGVNQQIIGELTTINGLTAAIGETNQQIILSQAAGPGHTANDLLDQRDQLVAELNTHIKVQTVLQTDGTYNVFIGNGQPVVIGAKVSTLAPTQAVADPEKVMVALDSPFGRPITLLESQITGGTLGGLVKFRSETLDLAQNNLGRVAVGIADAFNQIHRTGQDLSGTLGSDFFSISGPIAYRSTLNTSAAEITAQIINSDYRLVFNGGGYDVTRLSDNTNLGSFTVPPNAVLPDGITLYGGTAAPVVGDVYVVHPGNPPGQRVVAESTNAGTGLLDSSGSNLQALTGSDYRLDFDTATNWTLTRLSDNVSWNAATLDGLQQFQPGFSVTLAGVPQDGDSFTIQPTRTAARNIVVAIDDPRAIAAAAPFRTAAGYYNVGTGAWANDNSGQAAISTGSVEYVAAAAFLGNPNLPLAPSPGGDIRLEFDPNALGAGVPGFLVTGAVTGSIAYDPTAQTKIAISVNGLSFTISGRPNDGDRFTLSANENGVADNRTAQRLGALQTTTILNGPSASGTAGASATFQSAYSQLVSQIGSKTREIEVTGKAQASLVAQSTQAKEELSGVNLDEEAANLLKYQQAYQAAAKMLTVASTLFEELLAINR